MSITLEQLSARMRQGEQVPLRHTAQVALTLSIASILQQIVVSAMEYIDAAMVGHIGAAATASVVDVGIHVNEEGKLCGDVQFAAAEPVVDAITPVPGGVGTVTTSVLVGHVVQAAGKQAGGECGHLG